MQLVVMNVAQCIYRSQSHYNIKQLNAIVISFRISGLLIDNPFEVTFVQSKEDGCNFTLRHVENQFYQHHLLKRTSFFQCKFLTTGSQISRLFG